MSSDIQTLAGNTTLTGVTTNPTDRISGPVERARTTTTSSARELPTEPCSVVWSRGHAYVLESGYGRARWAGVDDRGRPVLLTGDELRRRGWSDSRD